MKLWSRADIPTLKRLGSALVLFLTITAVWWTFENPFNYVEHKIIFNLVNLEVRADGGPLTYQHAKSLRCDVVDENGKEVATIAHFGIKAVTYGSTVQLISGQYQLRCELELLREKTVLKTQRLKDVFLGGGDVTVHF